MRILFCSQTYLTKELGAAKVVIELAEEMEKLGWRCTLVSRSDIDGDSNANTDHPSQLRRYLLKHAGDYDVVDYDHHHLPFPRHEFPERTLFVARSVLLWLHFLNVSLPREPGLKSKIRSLVFEKRQAARRELVDRSARVTVNEADLINVANYADHDALLGIGVPREKIAVIPNGLSRANRKLFDAVSSAPPSPPKVAFVGTFDNRKGSPDFPKIVESVCEAVPGTKFRLLGTARDEATVLAMFPRRFRNIIEVVPRYAPEELPKLLAPCSVGVFPSYIEGFGLGVLEMLAASIPVIAYNSPGPPMMLPHEYLVPRGSVEALSKGVVGLLKDREALVTARAWAKARSGEFCWAQIARKTSEIYGEHLQKRLAKLQNGLHV